jgi:hypothetical protein
MPDKEQSPSERIAEESRKLTERKVAPLRAAVERRLAEKVAAHPTPDLGKDEELEKALFYKRQWHQESARAERLDNENRAQADRIEALRAEREKLRAELSAAKGYLMNAKIDLETGAPKATALRTIEGGIARVSAALNASPKGSPDAP